MGVGVIVGPRAGDEVAVDFWGPGLVGAMALPRGRLKGLLVVALQGARFNAVPFRCEKIGRS